MKLLKCIPLLSLALVCGAAAPLPPPPAAMDAPAPNWEAVVGLYPQLGGMKSQGELAVMLWLQQARTQGDVTRTLAESHPSLGCFINQLNQTFSIDTHPRTVALLAQAQADIMPVIQSLQDIFARPRPYMTYNALNPAIPEEAGPSYPSRHAAVGTLFAHILSQFVPENAPAIMERGKQLGNDRVLGGVHWPSDAEAGQRLGHAFATYWIDMPEHRQEIMDICKAEWH